MYPDAAIDSVLLIGFGGPTRAEDVPEFVRGVVESRHGSESRIQQVIRQYETIGGISPFNDWTAQQAALLQAVLTARDVSAPVIMGMRNWRPWLRDVLSDLTARGHRHILGVIMAPHESRESGERYRRNVADALATLDGPQPQITYLPMGWHTRPGFIHALGDHIRDAAKPLGDAAFQYARIICTAHSIPQPANGCPDPLPCAGNDACRRPDAPVYCRQVHETADALAAHLSHSDVVVAYQSAAGGPVPWMAPDINDAIAAAHADGIKDVIVCPVGFLCDHVEVLYDLDRKARATAESCGLGFYRAGSAGIHPEFIELLASLIVEQFHAE